MINLVLAHLLSKALLEIIPLKKVSLNVFCKKPNSEKTSGCAGSGGSCQGAGGE